MAALDRAKLEVQLTTKAASRFKTFDQFWLGCFYSSRALQRR
jgi:hypothetical protein